MGRPRTYDEDVLLNAVEQLLGSGETVTVRALSHVSGATTGSIYHAFGSLDEILAAAWLRAASRFLETLERQIGPCSAERADADAGANTDADAGASPAAGAADQAILSAARTFLVLERQHPNSARLLMAHSRESLLADDLPDAVQQRASALQDRLMTTIRALARRRSGRTGRHEVDVVVACVVDIPAAILLARRPARSRPQALLDAAVRGVLAEA